MSLADLYSVPAPRTRQEPPSPPLQLHSSIISGKAAPEEVDMHTGSAHPVSSLLLAKVSPRREPRHLRVPDDCSDMIIYDDYLRIRAVYRDISYIAAVATPQRRTRPGPRARVGSPLTRPLPLPSIYCRRMPDSICTSTTT